MALTPVYRSIRCTGTQLKFKAMAESPNARLVAYLQEHHEVRYTQLLKLVKSRGSLALVLREMGEEGLLVRRIVPKKPVESYYSLTEKGTRVAVALSNLVKSLSAD